jgi:ferredoxin-NADP reductase
MNELRVWADALLGKITMYRLVIYGLVAIALAAWGLMFTGYLPYSPAAFLFSLIILVAVSYGTNRLFGWLFGVKPYAESAIITGLILALLFMPPVALLGYVKLALVATFASLSKYLIAVRCKHIFNPAAVAIVIASAGGVAFATWWIATPALVPVTIIVAFLILYKIEKLQMALVFLAIALSLLLIESVFRGEISMTSIVASITSWPLFFFAGIMLSEPLTMAPRRKQQMIVAAVVGVLVTTDFHYSVLTMTPALALVIGNALSFWYGIRRGISLRLVSHKKLGSDSHEFLFDTAPFHFLPGQYLEVSLPHRHADSRGIRRVFSIVGRPGDEQLALAMRIPDKSSTFKKAMLELKPGWTIHATRVAGDFVLPEDKSIPILFVAGGIGITPFMSFLQSAEGRKLTVIYAVSAVTDLMFVEQLQHYDVKVVVVTSDAAPLPSSDWQKEAGRVDEKIIRKYLAEGAQVYVSGPPAMVTAAKEFAHRAGAGHVRTDLFSGY